MENEKNYNQEAEQWIVKYFGEKAKEQGAYEDVLNYVASCLKSGEEINFHTCLYDLFD